MRMSDIMFFIFSVNIAAFLVSVTGIFNAGPEGKGLGGDYFVIAAVTGVATALAVGGVSVMGWSFKIPAVISIISAFYIWSIVMMDALIVQIIQPIEVAGTFVTVFTIIATVVGIMGLIQIAGGAHGTME